MMTTEIDQRGLGFTKMQDNSPGTSPELGRREEEEKEEEFT